MTVFIRTPGVLTAPDPNLITVPNYTALLSSVVRAWLSPDAARRTMNGTRVSAVSDRAASAASYAQASVGNQPLLVAGATPSGRDALQFATSRSDRLVAAGALTDVSGDFGLVVLNRANEVTFTPSGNRFIAYLGDNTNRAWIRRNNEGRYRWSVGSDAVEAAGQTTGSAVTTNWTLLMLGWDSVSKTVFFSSDGGATWTSGGILTTGTNLSAPQPGNGTLTLGINSAASAGSGSNGQLAEAIALPFNPAAGANAASLLLIQQFFAARHSVGPLAV